MAKVFKVTPKRIKRTNGLVLTHINIAMEEPGEDMEKL